MPHPITTDLEKFWREHGGRHDSPQWQAYVQDFGSLLIDKLVEMSEEHDNEGRFGMSKAGGCTRAVALRHLGYDSETLTGSTRATFAIGHKLEIMAIATLRACGYPVIGLQRRISIEPVMSSATDGEVIVNGQGMNLSVKTMGYKMSGKRYAKGGVTWTRHGFAAMAANGVHKEQPGHWMQMQAEMHATGLAKSIYVVVAKDMIKAMEADPVMIENGSLTFYVEEVDYDPAAAGIAITHWARTWNEVTNGFAGKGRVYTNSGKWHTLDPHDATANKAATGTYDPCSYCDLREACTVTKPLAESVARLGKESAA